MRRTLRYFALTMCLVACKCYAQGSNPVNMAQLSEPSASPIDGESWLNHVHRSFGDTSMGKTGRLGPSPSGASETIVGYEPVLFTFSHGSSVTLRGSDLYRLNCQACHGEAGAGAPPEINSIIDPVRATSVPTVMERMKKRGMEITPAAAAELAKQSQDALLQRLHNGGQAMPPFSHLSEAEIRALLAYLNQLAGVPGAKQLTVTEPPVRVGEHIVKSTCHICHDAAGANPTPQDLENGAIPPLEALTTRTDALQLIRKVTSGAPVMMGTPPTPHRGRMPVFYYLSPEEAADVYLYLTMYPPSRVERASAAIAATQQNPSQNEPPPAPPALPHTSPKSSGGIADGTVTLLMIGLTLLAMGMAAAGLGFVAYELCRLGRNGESHVAHAACDQDIEAYRGKATVRRSGAGRLAL